jgi:hypothetical protein
MDTTPANTSLTRPALDRSLAASSSEAAFSSGAALRVRRAADPCVLAALETWIIQAAVVARGAIDKPRGAAGCSRLIGSLGRTAEEILDTHFIWWTAMTLTDPIACHASDIPLTVGAALPCFAAYKVVCKGTEVAGA